jgi:hypothetical protein
MTPRELNKQIKLGQFYYLPYGAGSYATMVHQARSRRKGNKVWCEVRCDSGWKQVEGVRLFGTNNPVPLIHEGVLAHALN